MNHGFVRPRCFNRHVHAALGAFRSEHVHQLLELEIIVGENARGSNLFAYDFKSAQATQLTKFLVDSVVFPCVARDGSLIVFRHLFDLYSYYPGTNIVKKLDLWHNADRAARKKDSRLLTTATAAAFSPLLPSFQNFSDSWTSVFST